MNPPSPGALLRARAATCLGFVVPLLGYLALTLLYYRPLAFHFLSSMAGRAGDNSADLWNMWYFRYSLVTLHANPFWTDTLYWPYGANLLTHGYGLAHNLVAFFLLPWLGPPATHNVICVSIAALAGYAVFLMATDWGAPKGIAFVSGALYTFNPFTEGVMLCGGAFDYRNSHVIAIFVWMLCRAIRGRRLRDAILAAGALTWVWACCYYYFMFCCLLIPVFFLWLERPFEPQLVRRPVSSRVRVCSRLSDAAMVASLLWVLHSLAQGQREFHGAGTARALFGYVMPYLVFWGLLFLRLALIWSVKVRVSLAAFRQQSVMPYLAVIACWAALNWPMVGASLFLMGSGDYITNMHPWRGGGNPTDLLLMLAPNSYHPIWGRSVSAFLARLHLGPSIPLGYLPLAGAFVLWRWQGFKDKWTSLWFFGAIFSFIMTLGPWLRLCSVHTYLPLPFYFLHLLPIFNNIQVGAEFIMFVALFLALLFSEFLKEAVRRVPPRLAAVVPIAAFLILAAEFVPVRANMLDFNIPPLIERLGQRPDGAMLTIPYGAVFDGTPEGALGVAWLDMSLQLVHHKPYVGGALGRVAQRTYLAMRGDPFLQAILRVQAGGDSPPLLLDRKRTAEYFRSMRLRYVLVSASRTPEKLQRVIGRWPLESIDSEGDLRLYSVRSL
ncbi:MAG: hypothetical protein NTY77_14760 [Elusimicrobia bacterium]|nr:hypothetical protein [Elusimicrobiota bacterium]